MWPSSVAYRSRALCHPRDIICVYPIDQLEPRPINLRQRVYMGHAPPSVYIYMTSPSTGL